MGYYVSIGCAAHGYCEALVKSVDLQTLLDHVHA